jgi:hypothetical protein
MYHSLIRMLCYIIGRRAEGRGEADAFVEQVVRTHEQHEQCKGLA